MTAVATSVRRGAPRLGGLSGRRRVLRAAPVLLVLLFASLPVVAAFREPLYTMDESLLLVYPEQILAGDVPNRDFFTSYGPGGLTLLATIYAAVGPSVLAERMLGLLYHAAIASGVLALTRRLGIAAATIAGVLSSLLLLPLGLGAYVWLGSVALIVWSLALLSSAVSTHRAVMSGVLGSLAVAWRPETAVIVFGASAPLLWASSRARPWLMGAALGATPLIAHAVLGGWQLWSNVVDRVGVNTGTSVSTNEPGVTVALILTVGGSGYLVWRALRERTRVSASWAILTVLLLPQALQRIDLGHVLYVGCVVLPLTVAVLITRHQAAARLGHRFGTTAVRRIFWTAACLLLLTLSVQAGLAALGAGRPTVTHESRSMPVVNQEEKRALEALLALVEARVPTGSRVFLGGQDMSVPTINDMRLYHVLPEYEAKAFNLEMPAPQPVGSALTEDIMQSDALILNEVPAGWGETLFPYVQQGDDEANEAVADHFCLAEKVYAYSVYVRCA